MSFKHFKLEEFKCSETGENDISLFFVANLDALREACGFPFIVTSGFRSVNHSKEVVKEKPGMHTLGLAADIAVNGGSQRFQLVKKAIEEGIEPEIIPGPSALTYAVSACALPVSDFHFVGFRQSNRASPTCRRRDSRRRPGVGERWHQPHRPRPRPDC